MNIKHLNKVLKRAKVEYIAHFHPSDVRVGLDPALKSSIQLIAELIQNNQLTPCIRCEKDGISMGYVRMLDAAGSLDYEECPSCTGWTVVSVEKENG